MKLVTSSLALLAVLSGCKSDTEAPVASTLTIAFEGPLTGDQASNGQDMLRGVRLAVAETNLKGGVLGLQVVLVEADDKADAETGKRAALEVVAGDSVAVIGPYNSAVGLANLETYIAGGVVPVHMTSSDDTTGQGVTVQPKNSQISPVEIAYIEAQAPSGVSMLVDPSAYTQAMADRLEAGLTAQGIVVSSLPIMPGATDYAAQVAEALTGSPGVVYVSTYFPEGALIAVALAAEAAGGNSTTCFMGLANQDPAFITASGLATAQTCVFSGVPTPQQFPSASDYLAAYTTAFATSPGTWGTFTYDSANVLFAAMEKAGSTDYEAVLDQLKNTSAFPGATGPITIDPMTGSRVDVPVKILKVGTTGLFEVVP